MSVATNMADDNDNVVSRFPERLWHGSEREALHLELVAVNELRDLAERELAEVREEIIALRMTLGDEQRKRVAAETKLRRADASELLYENVLDRCADYLMGADPIMAIPQHEIDRAKRAGVSTQYAEGYHRRIMAALVAGRDAEKQCAVIVAEEKARARSCVQQGLAGVSDEDLAAAFVERFGAVAVDLPNITSVFFDNESARWMAHNLAEARLFDSAAEAIVGAKRLAEGT